ncbi:MAG: hypothetical protein QG582_933 [Candidatus Thermoplasmatota archaeon]|nr:hypothetical protein [Candidatus Thermoplasmatota archaeon]
MADLVKGMRDWLTYSTLDEDEWDTMRKVHLEQQLRRLFGACSEELETVTDSSELGEISVPVRSGALRRLRSLPGKVFVTKDEYEDGQQFKVHLMVSADTSDGSESWKPVCAWTFDSISEVADFVRPPSTEAAS